MGKKGKQILCLFAKRIFITRTSISKEMYRPKTYVSLQNRLKDKFLFRTAFSTVSSIDTPSLSNLIQQNFVNK